DIAEALYTGIIHDTGVFQYSNTTPETMRKGAKLISYGFNFAKLIEETFYQRTYIQSQIMGRALMESIRFMDNRCIVSVVTRKTMEFYNVGPKDLDGIVNHLRNIKGINCAIFMYETEALEYKVSMRSDEKVDVAKVAVYFGGGGHARAAGCTMRGTFYDCVNNLSQRIAEQLEGQ
ncbi:MAG: DHHA1 domain-containing protein, partial [Butyrivibrio sp.]|nr:DHHA1 domain-containing protein [Butyrivibrio sp.]